MELIHSCLIKQGKPWGKIPNRLGESDKIYEVPQIFKNRRGSKGPKNTNWEWLQEIYLKFPIRRRPLYPHYLEKNKNDLQTRNLIVYDMGNFSLCQQTNVQEGFKKRHNKLALLAEPHQTPPPLNLGPVIGSYHGFETLFRNFRVHSDNDYITGWVP